MYQRFVLGTLLAAVFLCGVRPAAAEPFPNSLWLGTDNTDTRNVLNTDRSGNVLRTIGPLEANGFAINLSTNTIFFSNSETVITARDLTTLAPIGTLMPGGLFTEDMTYDTVAGRIWRADINAGLLQRINPSTGMVDFTFNPGFAPLGVAFDGQDLWVSQFAFGGQVTRFTTAGVPTGQSFNVPGVEPGGLGFDTTDNTLWLGTFGEVIHLDLAGNQLGSFAVPANQDPSRFVDGLEFEGGGASVPEPSSLALLGVGSLGLIGYIWKRRRQLTA